MNWRPALLIALLIMAIAWSGQIPGMPKSLHIPFPTSGMTVSPTTSPEPIIIRGQEMVVTKIIDGDTIELANGEKVRYIGIDAPEKQNPKECFSGESTRANADIVLNKSVRLEKDKTNRDRYGRLLRYVYVQPQSSGAAEIFVNEYLVRNGYAYAKQYKPDIAKHTILENAQRNASASARGLWNVCY